MFEWLVALSLQFVIFSTIKYDVYKTQKRMKLVIVDKNIFKIMTLPNNFCDLVLISSFKTIILCCVHSIWFVKYMFSAEIWFVKTLSWIMKYESQLLKSNLDNPGQNIFELYKILVQVRFITSKTKLDI